MLHIGDLHVTGYWLMTALGVAAAASYVALTCRGGKVGQVAWYHMWTLFCIALMAAFIGGKLAGMLVNAPGILRDWRVYKADPAALWAALTAGRSFYGGFLLLVASLWWYSRANGLPLDDVGAILTPSVPLYAAFGRVGCFLGGCCYGVPVSWGVVFPEGSLAPAGVPLFPSQLAEAAVQFLLFIVLAVLTRRIRQKWLIFPLYLGGYAVMRFLLEFWRGDPERGVWLLSAGQWTSMLLLAVAAIIVWTRLHKQYGAPA
ncbi:MAG: prolipoprotein diacylglyceryl transferase [Clostridia bacterium]|nr:prolipoprotein diacylglyceryl transferase [Clostridia bacterium]